MKVDTIIFDLGGVLIDGRYDSVEEVYGPKVDDPRLELFRQDRDVHAAARVLHECLHGWRVSRDVEIETKQPTHVGVGIDPSGEDA